MTGLLTGRLGTLALPRHAPDRLREALGLAPGAPLRLAYVTGPGDVVGTYARWLEGRDDERGAKLSYSGMFYDLADAVRAEALVAHMTPADVNVPTEGPARFVETPMAWGGTKLRFQRAAFAHARRAARALRPFAPHATVVGADTAFSWLPLLPGRIVLSVHNTFWPADTDPSAARLARLRAAPGLPIRARAAGAVAIS